MFARAREVWHCVSERNERRSAIAREILAASEGASAAHERDEEEEGNARHVYPSAAMTAAFAASIVKRQSACIARFALRSKPMSLEMSNILRGSE